MCIKLRHHLHIQWQRTFHICVPFLSLSRSRVEDKQSLLNIQQFHYYYFFLSLSLFLSSSAYIHSIIIMVGNKKKWQKMNSIGNICVCVRVIETHNGHKFSFDQNWKLLLYRSREYTPIKCAWASEYVMGKKR